MSEWFWEVLRWAWFALNQKFFFQRNIFLFFLPLPLVCYLSIYLYLNILLHNNAVSTMVVKQNRIIHVNERLKPNQQGWAKDLVTPSFFTLHLWNDICNIEFVIFYFLHFIFPIAFAIMHLSHCNCHAVFVTLHLTHLSHCICHIKSHKIKLL